MGNTLLDKSLVEQIGKMEGVDKVFGRMEMAGLSVSSNTGEGTITLISYDDNQFGWAKEELNKGSITPAMENADSVLVLSLIHIYSKRILMICCYWMLLFQTVQDLMFAKRYGTVQPSLLYF